MGFSYLTYGYDLPSSNTDFEVALGATGDLDFESLALPDHTLVFDPVLEDSADSPNTLLSRLRTIPGGLLQSVDLIILRGSGVEFVERWEKSSSARSFLQNLGLDSALLVSQTHSGLTAPTLISGPVTMLENQALLPVLRQVEIESLLRQCGAILQAGRGLHFLLPSGQRADLFVRVGDALTHSAALRRIAEWILPYVTPDMVIVADTRSLIPLLLQIQVEFLLKHGVLVPVHAFSSYPSDDERFLRESATLSYRFPERQFLFIISVNSSGKLLARIDAFLDARETARSRSVVICDTGGSDTSTRIEALSSLSVERWIADFDAVDEERTDPAIVIEPSNFERVFVPQPRPVKVQDRDARKNREFWEAADRTDAIHFHYDAPYVSGWSGSSRHFPIYIDVLKILSDPEFRATCERELLSLPPPKYVLIPKHANSQGLAEFVNETFNQHLANWSARNLRIVNSPAEAEPWLRELQASESVLIVDDALVTGGTLSGWRRDIQKITNTRDWINVSVFVPVARPYENSVWTRVQNRYTSPENVIHLRSGALIYLPLPGGRGRCPWCEELELLSAHGGRLRGGAKRYADERLRHIRDGEVRDWFLLGQDRSANIADLRIRGSFFGELNHRSAIAAAIAAVQEVLYGSSEAKRASLEILDMGHFMGSFIEDVLHAGMLRAAPRTPFQQSSTSQLSIATMETYATASEFGLAELGWAVVTGRLARSNVMSLLARHRKQYASVDLVYRLWELNYQSQQQRLKKV